MLKLTKERIMYTETQNGVGEGAVTVALLGLSVVVSMGLFVMGIMLAFR